MSLENQSPSLPLFVQNAPRAAESDMAAVPYIRIFDKQAGEWREIALVCGEGKRQKENVRA